MQRVVDVKSERKGAKLNAKRVEDVSNPYRKRTEAVHNPLWQATQLLYTLSVNDKKKLLMQTHLRLIPVQCQPSG